MPKLYHADIYIPREYTRPAFNGYLSYSTHAEHAAKTDRYGRIERLPVVFRKGYLDADKAQLIEVEVDDRNRITKQVWRAPYDAEYDLVIVITWRGAVKTVWLNSRTDVHHTLKTHLYEPAPAH